MIIDRKERVLKDLNHKIINKFIDKLYKQELEIEELKKKIALMKKLNNNNINSFYISNQNTHQNLHHYPKTSTSSSKSHFFTNVNTPQTKQSHSYYNNINNDNIANNTFTFTNHPIKNIHKFINIKHINIPNNKNNKCFVYPNSNSHEETIQSSMSLSRNKPNQRSAFLIRSTMSCENNDVNEISNIYYNRFNGRTSLMKKKRNISSDGVLSNNSIYNKTLGNCNEINTPNVSAKPVLDISFALDYRKKNKSVANFNNMTSYNNFNLLTTGKNDCSFSESHSPVKRKHKLKISNSTKELIGKTYEMVRKYQLKKKDHYFQNLYKK